MCDFIPGYVATFCNANFTKLSGDIIVVGQDDGKVYQLFSNKYDFFEKVRGRGKALQLKFSSETGKDMQMVGWTTTFLGNQNV